MFQGKSTTTNRTPTCPNCNKTLHLDDDLLHCDEHGVFFRYGPRLIMRCAPELQAQPILTLLPWQRMAESAVTEDAATEGAATEGLRLQEVS